MSRKKKKIHDMSLFGIDEEDKPKVQPDPPAAEKLPPKIFPKTNYEDLSKDEIKLADYIGRTAGLENPRYSWVIGSEVQIYKIVFMDGFDRNLEIEKKEMDKFKALAKKAKCWVTYSKELDKLEAVKLKDWKKKNEN